MTITLPSATSATRGDLTAALDPATSATPRSDTAADVATAGLASPALPTAALPSVRPVAMTLEESTAAGVSLRRGAPVLVAERPKSSEEADNHHGSNAAAVGHAVHRVHPAVEALEGLGVHVNHVRTANHVLAEHQALTQQVSSLRQALTAARAAARQTHAEQALTEIARLRGLLREAETALEQTAPLAQQARQVVNAERAVVTAHNAGRLSGATRTELARRLAQQVVRFEQAASRLPGGARILAAGRLVADPRFARGLVVVAGLAAALDAWLTSDTRTPFGRALHSALAGFSGASILASRALALPDLALQLTGLDSISPSRMARSSSDLISATLEWMATGDTAAADTVLRKMREGQGGLPMQGYVMLGDLLADVVDRLF